MSQSELVKESNLSKLKISRNIKKLEDKNIIEKTKENIKNTSKDLKTLKETKEKYLEFIESYFNDLL